jgi:hypothetical protein
MRLLRIELQAVWTSQDATGPAPKTQPIKADYSAQNFHL